ncbi:hypothetical protein Hanom_Chr00s016402g01756131 [Helianthus anomalus]
MTIVVETPVVSTAVSQPSTTSDIQTQAITIPVSKSQTKIPSPTKVYTRKRKFQVHDDDIPAPIPISSVPFNPIQSNLNHSFLQHYQTQSLTQKRLKDMILQELFP